MCVDRAFVLVLLQWHPGNFPYASALCFAMFRLRLRLGLRARARARARLLGLAGGRHYSDPGFLVNAFILQLLVDWIWPEARQDPLALRLPSPTDDSDSFRFSFGL